jgi:hypothetical protein
MSSGASPSALDYDETFSPVVKPATIRTVPTLALSRDWPDHQLDVTNAFLHGTLTETVYCTQPIGFVDPAHPDMVCKLNKSLYGLKQAPRAWYSRFATFLCSQGFVEAKSDMSLFILRRGSDTAYLLLYVNDIVLTASSPELLRRIISCLQQEFAIKGLGALHHFLGVTVERRPQGMFLHQRQYTVDILERVGMADCKPCATPVDTQGKLSVVGPLVVDPTGYRSIAGALQYLIFTRPDIAYAIQQVCLPCTTLGSRISPRWSASYRTCGALSTSGSFYAGPQPRNFASTPMPTGRAVQTRVGPPRATMCSSATASSPGRRSASRFSRSSAEAEYRAVANGVAEAAWLRQLLHELHSPLATSTLVFCDNVSVVYLSTNPVQHQRTKHVKIDLHFVHERVACGAVRVLHVPTTSQFADVFTKGLSSVVFTEFRSSLNICSG